MLKIWYSALALIGFVSLVRAETTWLPEHWRNAPILKWLPSWPWQTWVVLAVVLLLIAAMESSFRLIHGEYELLGEIPRVAVSEPNNGVVLVSIIANIRNVGPPTALDGWSLEIVLRDGRVISGSHFVNWNQLTLGDVTDTKAEVYRRDQDILEQTITHPITTGNQVFGVAPFLVRGVSKADIWGKGTRVRLKYRDIKRNEHVMEYPMTGEDSGAASYIPGLGSTEPR